jgi:colicin import membrane protein
MPRNSRQRAPRRPSARSRGGAAPSKRRPRTRGSRQEAKPPQTAKAAEEAKQAEEARRGGGCRQGCGVPSSGGAQDPRKPLKSRSRGAKKARPRRRGAAEAKTGRRGQTGGRGQAGRRRQTCRRRARQARARGGIAPAIGRRGARSAVESGPLRDSYIASLRNRIRMPGSSRRRRASRARLPGRGDAGARRRGHERAVTQCNGDAAVRQSIENAVYRASPLPDPPDPALFQRNLYLGSNPMNKRSLVGRIRVDGDVVSVTRAGRNSSSRSPAARPMPFRSRSCRSGAGGGRGIVRCGAAREQRSGAQRALQDHGSQGHDRAAACRAQASPSTTGAGSTTTTSWSGKCSRRGRTATTSLRALQRAHRQRLLGYQISANKRGLRLASHQVADMVFEKILGVFAARSRRASPTFRCSGHLPHRTTGSSSRMPTARIRTS